MTRPGRRAPRAPGSTIAALAPLATAAILAASSPAVADRGPPDRAGYEWADSREPDVDYEWIAVDELDRTQVELLPLVPSSELALAIGMVDLGFSFELYGEAHSEATVLSLGALLFEPLGMLSSQCPLPSPWGPNGGVYGFLQALDPLDEASGEVWSATVGLAPDRRFVLAFEEVTFWRGEGTPWEAPADLVSFQIVLYEGSNEVQVNVRESGSSEGGGTAIGYDTVIGIESRDGTLGTGLCDGAGSLPDEHAIRFRRSTEVGLFPASRSETAAPGAALSFELEIVNFSADPVTAIVSAESASGWEVSASPREVLAGADGGAAEVLVALSVPREAPSGASDEVTVRARAAGVDLEATLWVRVSRPDAGWERVPPLPMALDEVELVAWDGALYALGGSLESELWMPMDATFRYRPGEPRWADGVVADLPTPISGGGACEIGGRFYYVGGYVATSWDREAARTSRRYAPGLLVYDPEADDWSHGPPLPTALLWPAVACDAEGQRVYAAGGVADLDGDGLSCCAPGTAGDVAVALLQVYDVRAEEWHEGPAPPNAFEEAAAGIVDGRLFVAGGFQPFFGQSLDTRILDVATAEWSLGPRLDPPRTEASGVVIGRELCLLGGRLPSTLGGSTDRWECFDGHAWAVQDDSLSEASTRAGAAVLDGQVYVVGGRGANYHAASRAERWPASDGPDGDADADLDFPSDGDGPLDAAPDGDDADVDVGAGGGGCGCRAAGTRGGAAAAGRLAAGALLGLSSRPAAPRPEGRR